MSGTTKENVPEDSNWPSTKIPLLTKENQELKKENARLRECLENIREINKKVLRRHYTNDIELIARNALNHGTEKSENK